MQPEECLHKAMELERRALGTSDEAGRRDLLRAARHWRALADRLPWPDRSFGHSTPDEADWTSADS